MRIVSLVPAGTDMLFALGLGADVVGVSHECDLPAGMTSLPRLTRSVVHTAGRSSAEIDAAIASQVAEGTPIYTIDAGMLEALHPDLVLTQGLCDVCALPAQAVQTALRELSWRPAILSLDAEDIDGVFDSIRAIGERTGCTARAQALGAALRSRLARVTQAIAARARVPVVCLEWLDPPYACGHWVPEMVERAGGTELLGRPGMPSVRRSWADIARVHPSRVIAMPCGYDLGGAVRDVERVAQCAPWNDAVGDAAVYVAAGGLYFTRPGPGLVTGIEVLASVLHPDVVTWPVPADAVMRWPGPAALPAV